MWPLYGGASAMTNTAQVIEIPPVAPGPMEQTPRQTTLRPSWSLDSVPAMRMRGLRTNLRQHLGALVFFGTVILVLWMGWENRDYRYLTAKNGLGYALGIVGGVLMLVLLLYPARKRLRFMRKLGPVKYWFKTHMMLGVLGPACILFHADFHLGSLNSNIALGCMLMVASSGLIGRYIYSKIHYGLYGGKATLEQLRSDKEHAGGYLEALFALAPGLGERLRTYEAAVLNKPAGVLGSALRRVTLSVRGRWAYLVMLRKLRAALRLELKHKRMTEAEVLKHSRSARLYLSAYLATIERITVFGFYERIFSLWHVLHMPLFLMMLVSGIVHVVAVHMY